MEKEKGTFEKRITNVRELAKKSMTSTFWYESSSAPSKKRHCTPVELSMEEVEEIIPKLSKVFNQEIEVSKFNIVSVSAKNYLKLGIASGQGIVDGKKCKFEYLITQDTEFAGVRMSCKDEDGRGMDHEIYPISDFSSMFQEAQDLTASVLDIVEKRLG